MADGPNELISWEEVCSRLRAENERLRELVAELADELEFEFDARYVVKGIVHPALVPKYNRDMDVCRRARKELEGEG